MKFLRHRRGLSNVVTAAMLLTSVTVMGTGLVAWSNGNLKVFEMSLANTSVNATNKINENLSIENVAFCSGCNIGLPKANVINVTLSNTGTLTVKVIQIQINSTIIQTFAQSTTLPVNISPHQSYTVGAQLPNTPSPGVWHSKSLNIITVTTARGSIITTQAAAQ